MQIREEIKHFNFRHVHAGIRFGTASDRYAGWIGQIYGNQWASSVKTRTRTLGGKKYREQTLPVACVAEYFEHFTALELDFTFYRPLRDTDGQPTKSWFVLASYAEESPDDARIYLKAPQQVTARIVRERRTSGRGTATTPGYVSNPDFLNTDAFTNGFLYPAHELLGDRLAGIIFEQEYLRQNSAPDPEQNIAELDDFFSGLGSPVPIHLELRSPHLLTRRYYDWLESTGLGQVFSHWTWLPSLGDQWKRCGERVTSSGNELLFRLLTPLRIPYARAYEAAFPFDKPVPELSDTRQAERMIADTASITLETLKIDKSVTIISNNRAWGNAPSLAQKVAGRIAEELDEGTPASRNNPQARP